MPNAEEWVGGKTKLLRELLHATRATAVRGAADRRRAAVREHLTRDATASAARGASQVAQAAVMKVFEKMLAILTPEQVKAMTKIIGEDLAS